MSLTNHHLIHCYPTWLAPWLQHRHRHHNEQFYAHHYHCISSQSEYDAGSLLARCLCFLHCLLCWWVIIPRIATSDWHDGQVFSIKIHAFSNFILFDLFKPCLSVRKVILYYTLFELVPLKFRISSLLVSTLNTCLHLISEAGRLLFLLHLLHLPLYITYKLTEFSHHTFHYQATWTPSSARGSYHPQSHHYWSVSHSGDFPPTSPPHQRAR